MKILGKLRQYAELEAPIIQRILRHGDEIGIGCMVFLVAFMVWSVLQW